MDVALLLPNKWHFSAISNLMGILYAWQWCENDGDDGDANILINSRWIGILMKLKISNGTQANCF